MHNYETVNDGVTHINIYSRGKTELGRILSNFSKTPFMHPEYGLFNSVEGFYYYVSTGLVNEDLREVSGFLAKSIGKKYPRVKVDNFTSIIDSALRAKVRCNGNIKEGLIESTLPFTHYYVFGDHPNVKVIVPEEHQWFVEAFEKIRSELKEGAFL